MAPSDVGVERVAGVRIARVETGPEPGDPLLGRSVGERLGVDPPCVCSWIRSSPTAAAAVRASSMSPGWSTFRA